MKILPDTNVWIRFFRNPAEKEEFEGQLSRPLMFMSSVVALELLRDAGPGVSSVPWPAF